MAIIMLVLFSPAIYRTGYHLPSLEARLYYESIHKNINPSNRKDTFIKKGSTQKPKSIFNEKGDKKIKKTDTEPVNSENKKDAKKEFDNTVSNIEKDIQKDEPNKDAKKLF